MDIKFSDKNGVKPESIKVLICNMLDVLEAVGFPFETIKSDRSKEQIALSCMTLCSIKEDLSSASTSQPLTSKQIITVWNNNYSDKTSVGSYDSIRDGALKRLLGYGIICKESGVKNSSTAGYYVSQEFVDLVKSYGQEDWSQEVIRFSSFLSNRKKESQSLVAIYAKIRKNDVRFLKSLRTKPFLLLAGISGTGKSQKVQELAFMTCPDGKLRNEGGTTPGNYCLVEVKPNWHDSTELLGYYSALSGKYELTDFIRFAYKASQNKDVPFFLCLDEMNLAPVEQYFAEFLSVLETRKKVGDEVLTQYLLSRDRFSNCKLQKKVLVKDEGDIIEGDKQYKMEFLYSEKDAEIITYLKENGLTLPDNLFVIGTVNMDDTTHQFSRKVIDRAFTIEMNGGKMSEMFSPESKMLLEYRDEPIPLEAFKAEFVRAYEVLDDTRFAKYKDVISTRIPELLGDSDGTAEADSINGILNETPFRVSYRVQNELVLYLSTLIERANFPEPDQIEGLIGEATLAILLEKVLPRVQGEQKQLETQNGKSNVLKDLKNFVESHFKPEEDADVNSLYNQVLRKLKEMDDKLANYYTNFF